MRRYPQSGCSFAKRGEPGDAADCRRAAGLAPVARVVSHGGEPAVPGQQCRGRHRKDPGPVPPRDEPCERGEPGPVGWLVPHPARVPAQHRVLVPEHQQLGVLRLVPAEHQDSQAKSPAHEQVGDLERHSASEPSPHHPFSRNGSSTMRSSFRATQDCSDRAGELELGTSANRIAIHEVLVDAIESGDESQCARASRRHGADGTILRNPVGRPDLLLRYRIRRTFSREQRV